MVTDYHTFCEEEDYFDNDYSMSSYDIKRRKHPMTLLAALIYKDGVLIGSDSTIEDDCGTYVQPKLWQLLDCNLVWGGSGDGRIIDDLRIWLNSQKSFEELDSLTESQKVIRGRWIDKIANQLADLNGRNIRRTQNTIGRLGNMDLSIITGEVLIGGFFKEAPLLLTINRQGAPSYDTLHGFAASGSERDRFVGALQALSPDDFRHLPSVEALTLFARGLDASIKNSSKADFPVQMWRSTKDSVEQILGLEDADTPTLDRLKRYFEGVGK